VTKVILRARRRKCDDGELGDATPTLRRQGDKDEENGRGQHIDGVGRGALMLGLAQYFLSIRD
jgi:hypothetical protein